MKNYIKLISLFVSLILLSGCVKYNANMVISNNKSVNFEIKYGFNKELIPTEESSDEINKENADYVISLKINETYSPEIECTDYSVETSAELINVDENFNITALKSGIVTGYLYDQDTFAYSFYIEISDEEGKVNNPTKENEYLEKLSFLKDSGYLVKEYSEKQEEVEYVGIKISKTFSSIDNITGNSLGKYDFVNSFSKEKNFDDTKIFGKKANGNYVANLVFDFSKVINDLKIDTSKLNDESELFFEITLPTQPVSNNANKISSDGRTLTWELNPQDENEIKFEFAFNSVIQTNSNGFIKYIVAGVGIILVIVLVLFIIKKKTKKKNGPEDKKNNNNNQAGSEPRTSFFKVNNTPENQNSVPSQETNEDVQTLEPIENLNDEQNTSTDEPEMLN